MHEICLFRDRVTWASKCRLKILALCLAAPITAGPMASSEPLQFNDAPLEEGWAPSEWGPDDKIGAMNRMTPEKVLLAATLIRHGKVATLGKSYSNDMPFYGNRGWTFSIVDFPPEKAWGRNQAVAVTDHVEASIGQVGTQFDGPGHMGVKTSNGVYFYNGRYASDEGINERGMGPLGVEHVGEKGFACRGVLLDAVGLRGGPLPVPQKADIADPGIISPDDIDAMIERQGIDPIGEGDCVFLHTGHGDIWDDKHWAEFSDLEKASRIEQFNAGEPGFGDTACEYLASRKVVLTGADNWSTEAFQANGIGERGDYVGCHIGLQTKHGIWNLENLDLSQLIADQAYEFMFVWAPLKIKGGTGSPANPVALY